MEKMTITEALAQVKLIEKKIESKTQFVLGNLFRYETQKDPFEAKGGARQVLESEIQALQDNYRRLEKIRAAIAESNIDNQLTVGEQTRSVHEWLTFKREVAPKQIALFQTIHTQMKQRLDKDAQQPQVYKDEEGKTHLAKLVTNLDYVEYVRKYEKQQEIFETLDGLLSLKNATTVIQF